MKIEKVPVLPLRDVVVYPNMVVPLFVGRDKSIKSLEDAMNDNNKTILLVTQKLLILMTQMNLNFIKLVALLQFFSYSNFLMGL